MYIRYLNMIFMVFNHLNLWLQLEFRLRDAVFSKLVLINYMCRIHRYLTVTTIHHLWTVIYS